MKMFKGKGCLLALVGVPLLMWTIYRLLYPSFSWTQRTTITVTTPSGDVHGSGTVRVHWRDGPDLFVGSAPHFSYSVEGEATIVNLGNGKYLFALIKGAERLGLRVFGEKPLPRFTNALISSAKMTSRKKGAGPSPIPRENYPLLVTFGDINDPASVKKVDPNNLETTFGPGYALKSITLEITNESVTEGKVEEVLGWFNDGKTAKSIWSALTHEQRDILSTASWIQGK